MRKQSRKTGYILQDIGLVLFLSCMGIMAITLANGDKTLMIEFSIMMIVTFLAVLLAGFKVNGFAVVVIGCEIMGYTAYKLYSFFYLEKAIQPWCYVWVTVPLVSVAAMMLFVYGSSQTELENEMLREQVEKLVMINPVTGLYNLKCLYNDLTREKAFAIRNHVSFSLMIITLRYEPELRKLLSKSEYQELLQKMSEIIVDTVRLEDKIYSLDERGMVGIIMKCDQEESGYAKKRLKASLEQKDAFKGVMDNMIKVEVKIACVEYDENSFGNDMIRFKQKVEGELQYDV